MKRLFGNQNKIKNHPETKKIKVAKIVDHDHVTFSITLNGLVMEGPKRYEKIVRGLKQDK